MVTRARLGMVVALMTTAAMAQLFVPLQQAATPGELDALQPAIEAGLRAAGQAAAAVDGLYEQSRVKAVRLGTLGQAFWVVLGGCSAANCPAILLAWNGGRPRQILDVTAAGFGVLARGGSVPEVAVVQQENGREKARWYRYDDGRYAEGGAVKPEAEWMTPIPGFTAAQYQPRRVSFRSLQAQQAFAHIRGAWTAPYQGAVIEEGHCDIRGNCNFVMQGEPLESMSGIWAVSVPGVGHEDVVTARRLAAGLILYRSMDKFGFDQCVPGDLIPCSNGAPMLPVQPGVDFTRITSAAQEHGGVVMGVAESRQASLREWQKGQWTMVPPPRGVAGGSEATGIWPTRGGGVAVLWTRKGTSPISVLVRRRGTQTRVIARAEFVVNPQELLADAGTAPLLGGANLDAGDAGGLPELARWEASGTLRRVYQFAADEFTQPKSLIAQSWDQNAPLRAIRDERGQWWIWTQPAQVPGIPVRRLRGVVIGRGSHFRAAAVIPGLPDAPIDEMWPWDKTHMAAAIAGRGLYLINIETLTAAPVSGPQPGALADVAAVIESGTHRFVIAEPAERRPATVWERSHGRWYAQAQRLTLPERVHMTWVPAEDGIWLGGMVGGLWFVPYDTQGRGREINWREGVRLWRADMLFGLAHGHLLAIERQERTISASAAGALQRSARQLAPAIAQEVTFVRPLHASGGRLWGIRADGLQEWDGQQWLTHALPNQLSHGGITAINSDLRGRVWLIPNCRLGPAGVYNPVADQWQVYNDLRTAYAQQRPRMITKAAQGAFFPVYGTGGQIAFRGLCGGLNYYDGVRWKLWQTWQYPGGHGERVQPPYFDTQGNLAVPIDGVVWEWKHQQWERTELTPAQVGHTVPSPPPCDNGWPESFQVDHAGDAWWTSGGGVYEGSDAGCREVLSGSAAQPFSDGRRLQGVLLDGHGHAFLYSRPGEAAQYTVVNVH